MKIKPIVLLLFLIFNTINCLSQKIIRLAEGGNVSQVNFTSKIPFRYVNKHIFIDVSINGTTYNFLFDSGADFSVIDTNYVKNADFKKIKEVKTSGSSFEKQKTQLIEFSTITISDIQFNKIGAAIMDLSFINDDYPCFNTPVAGVIGATLLRKAIWQINYANREIIISDDLTKINVPGEAFKFEMISKSWGSPLVNVTINGIDKTFTLDTGSSGNITTGTEFKSELNAVNYVAIAKEDKSKSTYTNYVSRIEQIRISDLNFQNQLISLEKGVSSLVGNEFFENYLTTFDWKTNTVFLELNNLEKTKTFSDFEILFKPNYSTNKIEINGIYNKELSKNDFSIGTSILTINEIDVSNLSKHELCEFWGVDWEKIRLNERIVIETELGKSELLKIDFLEN